MERRGQRMLPVNQLFIHMLGPAFPFRESRFCIKEAAAAPNCYNQTQYIYLYFL